MIMYILFRFRPTHLLEDYTFRTKEGKMINIKVSDQELEYIKTLQKKIQCFDQQTFTEYGSHIFLYRRKK